MKRSGDLRIATTSGVNALSRRRQRVTSLKDSTVDREMELHEAVRLRDRERLQKKDRDREFPKRRRIERYAMKQKNGGEGYRENESTEESDEEEYGEDEEDARIHFLNRLDHPPLQSPPLPNNRRSLRTLRSSPVLRASVDETIGVPIPRRARSTSIKSLHDYRNSSSGKLGEDMSHRRFPSSPATASHICAGGASPSPSPYGASMRKKMKSVEPRARALKSTSNPRPSSEIQDAIEIEVVEALFDLMRQSQSLSQSSKNEEKMDKDSVNDADGGFAKGGKGENKTFLLGYEKSTKVDPETSTDDSVGEKKDEEIEKEKFPNDSASQRGDGFLNIEKVLFPKESESCVKVDAYEVQDPKVTRADDPAVETKKQAKLEIDLMVPPSVTSSPEKDVMGDMAPFPKYMAHDVQKKSETISKDGPVEAINRFPKLDLEKLYHDNSSVRDGGKQQMRGQEEQKNQLQTSLSPFQISLGGWPSVLPHPGYMQSRQAVLPMEDSARFLFATQPPKFTFSQPRPMRSATHQYIARSIQQHQQLITKSLLSGSPGVSNLCGTMQPTQRLITGIPAIGEYQGKQNFGNCTMGIVKDKGSEVPLALQSTNDKEQMLQQASLHTTANNFLSNSALIFPLGHHQTTVMAPAKSSGPTQSASASGNVYLRSNSAGGPSVNVLPREEAVTSVSSPNLASNEVAPYIAVLQNNGCQFPISTNMAMPQPKGVQSPPLPLFNSSLYSSTMFNVSQSQKLSSTKIVDNNYRTLAAAHSTQTDKHHFPPSHPSSKSAPEGRKGGSLYADTHQRSAENRDELITQPFSTSFGLNTPSCPPLDFSSMTQNSGIFPVFQDMAWNGYQMAKRKNFQASDGKGVIGSTKVDDGLKRTLGKSETNGRRKSSSNYVSHVSMMGTSIVDGLAGSVHCVPSVASGNQQPFPPTSVSQTSGVSPILHQHQQQSIQLQKHYMQQMQQTGTVKINASASNVLPGSYLPGSFPIQNPFFSKLSVQTDNSSYSHHWQNLPRSTAPEEISQAANLTVMNIPQPRCSFGSHSVSAASPQGQKTVADEQPVLPVGSTSESSISKNTGGSDRTASNVVHVDAALASQQMDGPSQKSPPACRGNVPSVLNTCPGQLSELKY